MRDRHSVRTVFVCCTVHVDVDLREEGGEQRQDRKSTRLNSSHSQISYAVFCLKKKNTQHGLPFFLLTGLSSNFRRTTYSTLCFLSRVYVHTRLRFYR